MKEKIRKNLLYKRNDMTRDEIYLKSCIIHEKLFKLNSYKQCKYVFTYINIGSEVRTVEIINKALAERKKVAVPKILKDKKSMIFVEIKSLNDLSKGNFNILEPIDSKGIVSNTDTVFLVPGLAFDYKNYRIGYGGGYYDKYLKNAKYLKRIGLAYDFQIIDSIPKDEYDINIDCVITN